MNICICVKSHSYSLSPFMNALNKPHRSDILIISIPVITILLYILPIGVIKGGRSLAPLLPPIL